MARELRYAGGAWSPIGVKVAVYNVCDYALLASQQIVCHFHEDTSAYLTIGCRCCDGSSSSSSSSGGSSSSSQAPVVAQARLVARRHRVLAHRPVAVLTHLHRAAARRAVFRATHRLALRRATRRHFIE